MVTTGAKKRKKLVERSSSPKKKPTTTRASTCSQARQPSFYDAVYEVVGCVPRGRLVAYGWVASWLGSPRAARAVGYALAATGASAVPWQRVINAQGKISTGGQLWRPDQQRVLLVHEGICFDEDDSVSLKHVGFKPTRAQLRRWLDLGEKIRKANR